MISINFHYYVWEGFRRMTGLSLTCPIAQNSLPHINDDIMQEVRTHSACPPLEAGKPFDPSLLIHPSCIILFRVNSSKPKQLTLCLRQVGHLPTWWLGVSALVPHLWHTSKSSLPLAYLNLLKLPCSVKACKTNRMLALACSKPGWLAHYFGK